MASNSFLYFEEDGLSGVYMAKMGMNYLPYTRTRARSLSGYCLGVVLQVCNDYHLGVAYHPNLECKLVGVDTGARVMGWGTCGRYSVSFSLRLL